MIISQVQILTVACPVFRSKTRRCKNTSLSSHVCWWEDSASISMISYRKSPFQHLNTTQTQKVCEVSSVFNGRTQLAFTCSKLIMESLEQYVNLFKVHNKDTRTTSWRHFGDFIVNFEQISLIALVFPLLTSHK